MTVDAALPISDSEAPSEPQEIVKMALDKTTAASPLYFCHGGEHTLTLNAQQHSAWINQGVCLKEPPGKTLPLSASPAIGAFQTFADTGATWTITCPTKNAAAPAEPFQLWGQTEYTSPAYKIDVSLGHHRLDFVEASGNEQFQVIEYGEETTLKAREISYYTKAAMTFTAQWKLGEQDLQPAVPEADGWVTPFIFKPVTEAIHRFNVTVPSLYYESGYFRKEFPVHALAKTPWNNKATLQVNDKPVTATPLLGVICTRAKSNTLKLLNPDLLLKDSLLTLSSTSDLAALGITIADLNVAKPLLGPELLWLIESSLDAGKSGWFELNLACSKLKKDWEKITGRVISANLADEVTAIKVGATAITGLGAIFHRDTTSTLSLTLEPWMEGLSIKLEEVSASGLDVVFDPPLKQPVEVSDNLTLSWKVTGGKKSGFLRLQAVCPDTQLPLIVEGRIISNTLADEVKTVEVDNQPVQSARAIFRRQEPVPLVLTFEPWMKGLPIALEEQAPAGLGMTYAPVLKQPIPVPEGLQLTWSVTGANNSGLFTLRAVCANTSVPLTLESRVISRTLVQEITRITVKGRPVTGYIAIFFREELAELQLTFEPGMQGLSVLLEDIASPVGMDYSPPLRQLTNVPQDLTLIWNVTGGKVSGIFALQLVCPDVATKLEISCRLVANDLADDIEKIEVSGPDVNPYPINLSGMGALLRKGQNNLNLVITIFLKPESTFPGMKYKLTWLEGDLGVPPNQTIPSLDIEKIIENDKITIGWKSFKSTKDGNFTLELICEGRSLIIPGVVVNERSLNAIARIHFNDKDYPANTTEDNLRYPRDGVRRRVKVFLNSSPLAELIILGFIKPGIFLTQGGVDQKTSIDPTSGSTLEVDVANREFHFDMWGNPFNFGGNYTINITFPHKINVASLYCYITSPDPR